MFDSCNHVQLSSKDLERCRPQIPALLFHYTLIHMFGITFSFDFPEHSGDMLQRSGSVALQFFTGLVQFSVRKCSL